MVRKDASAVAKDAPLSTEDSQTAQQQPSSATAAAQQPPPAALLLPSTVANIALHSLLMVTVPFALFFTAHFGGLDSLFELTGRVPSRETKTYLGAGLAVLGVNLVIASFVITAFREEVPADTKKTD